jgi:hypothetical protein
VGGIFVPRATGEVGMKRMVVDKNYLESDELRSYLSQSKTNLVVITDYAQLEMLKGDALINILKSTEIPAEFPRQVRILRPIDAISGLKGKKRGLKKRFTSGKASRSFRKWCRKRNRAKAGDKQIQQKILHAGKQAEAQLALMLEDTRNFADNIEDATSQFTDEELSILRRHEPLTPEIGAKIVDGVLKLTLKFFALHPGVDELPPSDEVPYTFIFRLALCAYIHALRWRVAGGAKDALPERMRNDIIDVTYAAYAMCFDGLLSNDKMVKEIYENAQSLLHNLLLKAKK